MERGLDAVLPTWDWHEVHGRTVDAPPERALAALVDGPIATGAVRLLFRARGLRPTGTLLDQGVAVWTNDLATGPGHRYDNTYCPHCNTALIRRNGFKVTLDVMGDGHCPGCGRRVAGVWPAPAMAAEVFA